MPAQNLDLVVALHDEGVDEQGVDRAARLLRNQIADLDVDEVYIARGGSPLGSPAHYDIAHQDARPPSLSSN
jgi:hypothetical protein